MKKKKKQKTLEQENEKIKDGKPQNWSKQKTRTTDSIRETIICRLWVQNPLQNPGQQLRRTSSRGLARHAYGHLLPSLPHSSRCRRSCRRADMEEVPFYLKRPRRRRKNYEIRPFDMIGFRIPFLAPTYIHFAEVDTNAETKQEALGATPGVTPGFPVKRDSLVQHSSLDRITAHFSS